MVNMFAPESKTLKGKIVITEIQNPFGKGAVVRHVVRNTADDAVVASEMVKNTDIIKQNDITPVMGAFVKSVQTIISHGNAVRISGLGTFYIKTVSSDGTEADKKEGLKGNETFEVSFTPAKSLNQAAQKAQVETVKQCESEPKVETVQNMDTLQEGTDLSAGKVAMINGKRLRIAGDSDGSNGANGGCVTKDGTGLYLVPCDVYGNYKSDRSDWTRVQDCYIGRNVMTQVVFRVPSGLFGQYKLAIATRAPLCGSIRKELLIKKARCSVSNMVFDVT